MINKLLEIALSQVGVREQGGNNRGPKIKEYQAATELAPGAWPWCAALVAWSFQQWVLNPEVARWLNLQTMSVEEWRPKTAAAFGLEKWAKKRPHTTIILPETTVPAPGDIVVYDFSHTGIVFSGTKRFFEAVEGNTNGKGDRDSTLGDGVWLKTRRANLAHCFIRVLPRKK